VVEDWNPEGYAYIDLTDFRPGIVDDEYSDVAADHSLPVPAAATEAGGGAVAASKANTYRCVADRTGALIPLPVGVASQYTVTPPGTLTSPTFYPTNQLAMYILDAGIDGPYSSSNSDLARAYATNPDVVNVMFGFAYDTGGNGTVNGYRAYAIGRVFFEYSGAAAKDFFFMRENAVGLVVTPRPIPPGWTERAFYDPGSVGGGFSAGPQGRAFYGAWFAQLSSGVIGGSDAALTTFDTDVQVSYPGANYGATRVNVPQTPSINVGPGTGLLTYGPQVFALHQGRAVLCGLNPAPGPYEVVTYTPVRDPTGTFSIGAVFAEEFATAGIGAMASLNASELIGIRSIGGGWMIRGDIANPTIVRLPMLEPTYGVISKGVVCPIGFVYLTRRGVYVWNGGTESKHLSPQMDSMFWEYRATPTNEPLQGYLGRLAYWDGKVFVPNNFLFDTQGGGWWRLDDPANYSSIGWSHYDVAPYTGKLYAFPYKIPSGGAVPWYRFDRTVPASSYSWQSQPLVETRRTLVNFAGIELKAIAASDSTVATVTITLTGYDRNGVALTPATWTISDMQENGRLTYREADIVNFEARYVVIRIETSASTGPAPKVIGIRLHTTPGNPVVKG
jgi:hypothetical protein